MTTALSGAVRVVASRLMSVDLAHPRADPLISLSRSMPQPHAPTTGRLRRKLPVLKHAPVLHALTMFCLGIGQLPGRPEATGYLARRARGVPPLSVSDGGVLIASFESCSSLLYLCRVTGPSCRVRSSAFECPFVVSARQ